MYRKSNRYLVLFAVLALLSLTAGIAAAATVTQNITYQGKLTNAAGSPLTGSYSVTFNTYDVDIGGTALSTDSHNVTATNRLFTTPIVITLIGPKIVDGRPLWLGIRVSPDPEMTPRQEIRPVPYALSLRPGAWITSTDGSAALYLRQTALGKALIVATSGNDGSQGVWVTTRGQHSIGVYAQTDGQYSQGVYAITSGDSSAGVSAIADGPNSNGVVASSYQANGIYAYTDSLDNKYGVYTPDRMSALAYDTNSGDIAEYIPVTENVTPGTVLVIGEDGKLQTATTAYDTGIAGIVSTAPGVTLGTKEGGNPGEQIIAIAGRVPCKVDASNGPIQPRDLLTTSSNPGYAMKATNPKIGTILGKAMGTLESGTGTIEVLVTLQ